MHKRITPTYHQLVCHRVLCYSHESDAFINGLLGGSWVWRWCQWTGVSWQGMSSSTIDGLWVMEMTLNSLLILAETECLKILLAFKFCTQKKIPWRQREHVSERAWHFTFYTWDILKKMDPKWCRIFRTWIRFDRCTRSLCSLGMPELAHGNYRWMCKSIEKTS